MPSRPHFPPTSATLAAEIERLSPAEKLLLVEEELWDSIAKDSNAVEPPAWNDKALAEDPMQYAVDSSCGDSWENVKWRITGEA